ncbi:hypothetical protein [Pseudomonas graminis]|uniref:hypothetical protein n=1 Tax=Pseudomonas graminis TaxID=158627 RepID=UPI003C1FBAC9
MIKTNLNHPAGLRPSARVVAGPWPNYTNCRNLPERDRWEIYSLAKAGRMALEDRGIVMDEAYDQFIKRVCTELDL